MSAVCTCELDEIALAVCRWLEQGIAPMDEWDWELVGRAQAIREDEDAWFAAPMAVRTAWFEFDAMLGHAQAVEEECEATIHYPSMLLEAEPGATVYTTYDVERQLADREEWERESWLDTRTHVLAWHGWMPAFDGSKRTVALDGDAGYVRDNRRVANGDALKREYGLPEVTMETDFVRQDGCIVLNDDGSRMTCDVPVEKMGAVHREYRRRDEGRQPWMSPKAFGWIRSQQRADEKRARQREDIVRLLRLLKIDPKDEKVAARVRELGYVETLRSLHKLLARRGAELAAA